MNEIIIKLRTLKHLSNALTSVLIARQKTDFVDTHLPTLLEDIAEQLSVIILAIRKDIDTLIDKNL